MSETLSVQPPPFNIFVQYHGAPLLFTDILSYMNLTFTMCFTFECVLKLIAYGPGVRNRINCSQDSWKI